MIWGLSLHSWEEVMRGSLLAVGALGVIVGFATTFVVTLTREELEASKKELDQYKIEATAEVNKAKEGAAVANAEAAKAHERIADLSTQAEGLKKDTAEANVRAAEAQLALEKFKAPRLITPDREVRIRSKVRPFTGTPFDLSVIPGDPEALHFAVQIAAILDAEKWSWVEFNHPDGPFMQVYSVPGKPNIGQIGSWAVIIQMHFEQAERLGPAAKALADALDNEGFIAAAAGKPPEAIPNTNMVHIIVGKKIDPVLK
jgi:hypothetical protein